jgi:hypothetical protein
LEKAKTFLNEVLNGVYNPEQYPMQLLTKESVELFTDEKAKG